MYIQSLQTKFYFKCKQLIQTLRVCLESLVLSLRNVNTSLMTHTHTHTHTHTGLTLTKQYSEQPELNSTTQHRLMLTQINQNSPIMN